MLATQFQKNSFTEDHNNYALQTVHMGSIVMVNA